MPFFSISERYINKALKNYEYKVKTRRKVTSTNSLMKLAAQAGEQEFSVLIASEQSAGRGRMGRSFHSPGGSGVYMSILLRPDENINPLLITTAAAVCCARVFERMAQQSAYIKWVNDIYMNDRKVCGILTESSLGENGYAVLGIGINITMPKGGFPEEIRSRAGYLFGKKTPHIREKVIIELLREFMKTYSDIQNREYLTEYQKRSLVVGKEIVILENGREEKALALAVNDDYSLKVQTEKGEILDLNSGDVSIAIEALSEP